MLTVFLSAGPSSTFTDIYEIWKSSHACKEMSWIFPNDSAASIGFALHTMTLMNEDGQYSNFLDLCSLRGNHQGDAAFFEVTEACPLHIADSLIRILGHPHCLGAARRTAIPSMVKNTKAVYTPSTPPSETRTNSIDPSYLDGRLDAEDMTRIRCLSLTIRLSILPRE